MCEHKLWDDAETWNQITELSTCRDYSKLVLKAQGDPRRMWIAMQAECRNKAAKKLPHYSAVSGFVFPTRLSVEQCTSEAIAGFHATLISHGTSGIDLTCGLGIDAMAFAKCSESVMAIDRDSEVVEALEHNAHRLGIDNIRCICADSTGWLDTIGDLYVDWIFVDPARRGEDGRRLYSIADCSPDVVGLLPVLRKHCRKLIVKLSPMLDISDTLRRLNGVSDIYTVGTTTECKEVVVVCDMNPDDVIETRCHAVTVMGPGDIRSVSPESGNDDSDYDFVPTLECGTYLYEPFPALMKFQEDAWICRTYGVKQIAPSTHLYVSKTDISAAFPGHCYQIIDMAGYSKRDCGRIGKLYPRINVSTRNFIDSPVEVVKRLKIKEGGELRLFAVTDNAKSRVLLVCKQKC